MDQTGQIYWFAVNLAFKKKNQNYYSYQRLLLSYTLIFYKFVVILYNTNGTLSVMTLRLNLCYIHLQYMCCHYAFSVVVYIFIMYFIFYLGFIIVPNHSL